MFKFEKGKEMTPESVEKNKRKDEYFSEVTRRDRFLSSQKWADIEGTKNYGNYEEFNKNPSEHLINLYKKDLEKEYEILKKGEIDNDDLEMHLRNVEMLSRKMALFQEFGKKAEVEMLQDASKEELGENKIVNTFRSFTNKQFLDRNFGSLNSNFARKIRPIKYAALALMFSLSPIVNQSQNKGEVKSLDKNKLEDTRTSNIEKTIGTTDRTYDLGADFRFTTENENGEKESNILGGIIAPIALELDVNKTVQGKAEANIPLTYARDFKTTELANKEDSLKMAKYFEEQIREVVANTLIRIGETKGVYSANHEGENNLLKEAFSKLKITSINITGYASPEASTAKSVIPGNKEEENAKLSEKRAEIVKGVVEKILTENKVDSSVLDSINFEEVQFSDSEWENLIGLAGSLGIKGSAPEDQILELVSKYNAGEYNDNARVKKIMDDVVGSKRGATIEIEYETNKKTQIVVPIPLLLLLLLSKRIRRGIKPLEWKRNGSESDEEIKEEDGKKEDGVIKPKPKTPREIFSEKNIDEENVSKEEFNYYKLYETADKEINYQDQYLIRKYFLEGELSMYIDDEVSLKHGLDYRNLIDYISSVRDRYNTEEELKVEIARALLGMWEQYDRSIRKEAGIDINEKTTLDYRHDEKKILWAKIAAPEILRLARKYNDPKDLLVEIQKITQEIEEKVEKGREKDTGAIEIKPIGEKGEEGNKVKEDGEVSTTIPLKEITKDEISKRAYEIYEKRIQEGTEGNQESDWFEAEKQLKEELEDEESKEIKNNEVTMKKERPLSQIVEDEKYKWTGDKEFTEKEIELLIDNKYDEVSVRKLGPDVYGNYLNWIKENVKEGKSPDKNSIKPNIENEKIKFEDFLKKGASFESKAENKHYKIIKLPGGFLGLDKNKIKVEVTSTNDGSSFERPYRKEELKRLYEWPL